jgi:hypothetical protein
MVRATGDESIRQRLYRLWIENPYVTAKKACVKLGLDYKKQGRMANVRLSEFRTYHKFGSPQKPHNLPKHREFTWEGVVRPDGLPVEWGRRGWRVVENRNDMWVFRDPDGRGAVHWYAGGLVRLFLKGELQLAKAKELFGRAFSGVLPEDLFIKCLDARLKETYRKWTFELGAPVPRFDIRQFERSHGIRIFADGSNPQAFHVGESTPFWIDKLDVATDKFATEIQSHLDLIKDWQKESALFREWLQGMLTQNKTALKEYDSKTDHGIV